MQKYLSVAGKWLGKQRRDPRYIFVIIFASLLFTICFLQVRSAGLFDSVEIPIFNFINSWPRAVYDLFFAITQLGSLVSLIIWCGLAWYLVNRRVAITVLAGGWAAWIIAKLAKVLAHRGRPGDLLKVIHLFDGEKLSGYGFPSGHSTLVATCVTILYFQVSPRYRKYLLLTALLVGISRIYLGAHFPLDVVGGWALGALIGSLTVTIVGLSTKGISARKLKSYLIKKGMQIKSLQYADLDARGSRPIFIVTEDGKEFFGKIFGKQEHAADWLFKIFRFFKYKNLQAEEPHVSSRRNVEIEAFANLWAKRAGVRTPTITEIYNYGKTWILIQEKIKAAPLASLARVRQKSLEDSWRQVKKLHQANIAHRDLRAANIMIDKHGDAYLIDFGFAEVSATNQRMNMDNAELLMSMALVVGVDRTVAAAKKVLPRKTIRQAMPYLQKAVFSGATSKLLRNNKALLTDLKDSLSRELNIKGDVKKADVLRVNRRKLVNLLLFGVFVYVIIPQLSSYTGSLKDIHIASPGWFAPLILASLLTYILSAMVYVSLASVPLKIREASLVQIASSFMSKIIPGGLGGTALNVKYLNKAGMEPIETAAVVAYQTFIGFVMFIVPLGLFLLLNGTNVLKLIHFHIKPVFVIAFIVVAALVSATCALVPKIRNKINAKIIETIDGLRNIAVSPRDLTLAALASFAITVAYTACVYISLQAIGINIGISVVITVYALSVIAKSAIPVPGGLGPVEAAMIASLVGFGLSRGDALASVLIYRLATFWLPIPFSILAYHIINRKKYI